MPPRGLSKPYRGAVFIKLSYPPTLPLDDHASFFIVLSTAGLFVVFSFGLWVSASFLWV